MLKLSPEYTELSAYMDTLPVISTHSHHRVESADLDTLLQSSYVSWCHLDAGATPESRDLFLEKIRYNSYFYWLEKALQKLYGLEEPLSARNWEEVSRRIKAAYEDKNYHLRVLREDCRYEKIVLDAYWSPGADNGQPDLFTPTYRINMFLFGYSKKALDHNGNNPQVRYCTDIRDLEEYVAFIRGCIRKAKASGCVALKSALAYDRGLDFSEGSREVAQRVLASPDKTWSKEELKSFGDYIFHQICTAAAEYDLPLQCHTGLGILDKTSALYMREAIERHPETKFILFHGNYPWMDDLLGLVHNYGNVYPDLCWLPLISTSASERLIRELIDVGTVDKICWGCDTWSSEESLGALMAAKHALASALSRPVASGYYSMEDAQKIAACILYDNAKTLYKL